MLPIHCMVPPCLHMGHVVARDHLIMRLMWGCLSEEKPGLWWALRGPSPMKACSISLPADTFYNQGSSCSQRNKAHLCNNVW